MDLLPILIAVFVLALIVGAVFLIMSRFKGSGAGGGGGGKTKTKDREARLREANKKLAQNPLDPHGLYTLAEVYFEEETWDRAVKAYETLSDLMARGQDYGLDRFEVFFHYGQAALKVGLIDQAYKAFVTARSLKENSFEVNFNLGVIEFERKNYEKAVQILQHARAMNPESPAVLRYMGHSLFRMKKPKDAMSFIRKAIDLAPDDKESLYTLAECYFEANQTDQALKIFTHLRADPVMGPSACLFAGTIHSNTRKNEQAITDFEMGLKHQDIKPETLVELRYYLATTYLKQNEIAKAMPILKQIQASNASYKDVAVLIAKYQELNTNRNLQVFLMASSADFVALCRKVVLTYFPRAKVKLINIAVNSNQWADILAEVNTPKWADLVMFRFIRTQGSIGELIVRDFHSHLKDVKAGKGICITVGTFSDEAKRYTEARLIDLIEKDRLIVILNSVDAKAVH